MIPISYLVAGVMIVLLAVVVFIGVVLVVGLIRDKLTWDEIADYTKSVLFGSLAAFGLGVIYTMFAH